MRRIMMVIAYDGTNYCGWQIQPNCVTVEDTINKTLSRLLGESIRVLGVSRTDSGVHALGNVAVFDTTAKIQAEKVAFALNTKLPKDIRIQESYEVALDFHPRYAKSHKIYEYKIWNHTFLDPTKRLYSLFHYIPLDIELMKRAAQYLVGEHDFKSFCAAKTDVVVTIREIYSIDITQEDKMITIRVKGNGFLYNMIRIIVGTLMNVGAKVYEPEYIKEILEAKDRNKAGPTVRPEGLTLVKIGYKMR
jgi:pseudouridylate synthase I